MPSKTEEYLALAQRTANGLTRYWESWTDYLTTASRLYKYPFADQLMIYAQRPDATACADYDIWNNRMNRYVRRGSKGIALLDESSGFPRLHYVFDVSDTGVRRNSRDPDLWQYNDDLKQPVSEMLAATYGISGERVSQQLADVAGKLVADYWDNNSEDISAIVDGSLLMDYDEAGVEMQFKSAATMSVTYTLLERCGIEPAGWFDKDDFQAIYNFSTPDSVYALGAAVSDMSREVLRNIERTVKTTIRRRNAERSQYEYEQQERDLLDRRGLPAPEPDLEPAAEAAGQIRQDAPDIPDGTSPGAVQLDAADREAASTSARSGTGSGESETADDDRTAEAEPSPGQSKESTGVGAAHEQPESTGGRSDPDGTDLQLSFFNLSIPTEAQQIEAIDRAENEKSSSAFSLSQAEIEHELQHGSNFQDSKQRIIELYENQSNRKLRARALAKEYGIGGRSHNYLDGSSGFVNHDGKGLEFVHYPDYQKITLSWTQAEKYIDLMIHSDRYLTDKEKEQRTARQEAERQLPILDGTVAAEYTALKEQYPNTLVGFELNGNYLFYDKDAVAVERILRTNLLSQENVLGKVKVTGFPSEQWAAESKKLWAAGNNVYLAGLNKDGSHHQTKYLREADYLPIGSIIKLDGRDFRVEHVNFTFKSVSLQDMELTKNGLPIFRNEHLPHIRELYEEQQDAAIDLVPEKEVSYKVGDEVVVDLPTRTIEGTVGYIGDTDVRIDTSAHGQSWDNEVINKRQFEDGLRQNEPSQRVDEMLAQAETIYKESEVPEYERFSVREVVGGTSSLFAIWDDLNEGYYANDNGMAQFPDKEQAESYCTALKKETDERTAADWLAVEKAKFLAENEPVLALPKERDYRVGDTIRLDGKDFTVETVGTLNIQLRDPDEVYPVARSESKENLERLLRQPGNIHLHNLTVNLTPAPEPAGNFHITDDHLGEGGAKQKYARNIQAVRTLFKLEQEHRGATAEEQQVLSRYVGWGGLADAFDPGKDSWTKEYAELKGLLSEDEYAAARSSTLNAHYTSPTVIRGIYDAVERIGFRSGNILEPSMGVGNFFGMLPDTMQDSRLYGVELDSITGRIAKKLYPQADITVAGFETTDRRDFYDLAVGNVPFGQYKVNDKAYNKLGFSIHNYFFAKAIDQVRPGGVIAFVTSRYTMDSKDSTARKHMAERADLLGAIRLPNNAFKANAGTDVVSDIIFLQKRDRPADIEPAWVQLGKTEDGFAINQYFVDHPEMVLGELTTESTQYGREELTVAPIEGAVLADQLAEAVQHIEGNYTAVEIAAPDVADVEAQRKTLPADPTVKNFSYTVVDGEIYYRENSIMTQVELSDTAKGRVTGMVELRQIVNDLIDQQLNDYPDEDIQATQAKLNAAYDAFTAKYGLLNDRKNGRLFEQDSSYYLLCSLENLDEQGQLKSKAAMFTKRTIRPERAVTSVDTPSEALAVSIGEHGKVDLPYMAELLGTPGEYGRITTELSGVIFKDPAADVDDPEAGWQTADEYLSGNVRDKLRMAQLAAESHPEFKVNVDALTKAQPKDLEASEIDVRLGATWLAPSIVQQFMMETFQLPYRIRYNNAITVRYSPYTSEWRISNKSATGFGDIMATETYGTRRANAYKILEDTLNLRDSRVYDTIEEDGKEKRVLNQNETTLAQQKQQAIKDAFAGWVWKDPQRRALLVKKYNELFNSTRPREYDGSHIHFVGMNPEINLREHQRNAVAHVLYGYNTLLAHEVGAGKSFEMAASAMELKRLGLCQKSLFVVPNHLTEQWASEFLRLYPNAKLLVTSKKDFEPGNRKKFCARIATGDYDAVIIGHSQFEKIPLSAERQERLIQEQMDEIEEAIEEAKAQVGEHFTVKQLEKLRKSLKQKLEKLQGTDRKDDVVTFEQLGVDRLFVDESQAFKNLYLYTKMRNVAGLSTSEAQKSSDMFGKCRYLDEITGGRGVIFATGTPLSNSMTEMYTLMRYLQYNTLQQKGLTHFDAWASTFGETTTAIELAPEGTGYRARTRFAKFFNLPELMAMFKEAADIKTSDQLHLPVPDAKFETVVVKPSEIQQDMVQALSECAAEVHSGSVDPSVDNMLKITSDGRKIGLDQRLMNSALPDDPNSKLNACVNNVLRIWNDTKEQKLTQLIFCDMSTPKGDGSFNVYDDIRTKLLNAGVPEQEIEFIHNADTENKKAELFSKVRSGQVRVLLGSTAKMGAGTNVQTLLVAVHHLDVGWRPSDMTQRNGRIIRQGNQNKQVYVYNYVTESTFDAYLYQTLENKQKFISQIMTSKSPVRSCDDIDEQALSYAEIKALCAGDPRIREKMDLDVQVAKLKVLRGDFQNQKYRLEDKLLKTFPEEIQKQKTRIAALQQDSQIAAAHPQDKENFCGMTIKGMVYDDKKAAGERLLLARQEMPNADMMLLGTYRGFELNIRFDSFKNEHQAVLRAELSYPVSLGDDARGNITRLDNAIDNFTDRIADAENALQNLEQQKQAAEVEVAKPFAQEEELAEKSARLSELNALLNIDRSSAQDSPEKTEETPTTRPSVLAALEEKVNQPEPVKPFKSYLDKEGR